MTNIEILKTTIKALLDNDTYLNPELEEAYGYYKQVWTSINHAYLNLQTSNWRAASFNKYMAIKNYKLYACIIDQIFLENDMGDSLIADHVDIAKGYKLSIALIESMILIAKRDRPEVW